MNVMYLMTKRIQRNTCEVNYLLVGSFKNFFFILVIAIFEKQRIYVYARKKVLPFSN